MHELPITKNILDLVCLYAHRAKAQKVVTIVLELGVLRDLKKEWLERYFRYISRGTIASEADILVTEVPLTCKCLTCQKIFSVDLDRLTNESILCPDCQARQYEIITGMEFKIQGIEVV